MIIFDRSKLKFCDSATGDYVQIVREHYQGDYKVHYEQECNQFRLDVDIRRADADLLAAVSAAHFYSQERKCWLRFRDRDDLLNKLPPFLKAWAELDSERPALSQVLIRDTRPQSDPSMAQAIEPPSDAMLKLLQASFASKRKPLK
jgi:hypothetical protein